MRGQLALSAVLLSFSNLSAAVNLYTVTDLGPLYTASLAETQDVRIKINSNGKVIGSSHTAPPTSGSKIKAFVWDATNGRRNLSSDNLVADFVYDLNNSNTIVGWSDASGKQQATEWTINADLITWTATPVTIPGAVTSKALSVDGLGNIVYNYVDGIGVHHGYMTDATLAIHPLSPDLDLVSPFTVREGIVLGEQPPKAQGEIHAFSLASVGALTDLGGYGGVGFYSSMIELNNGGTTLVGGAYLPWDTTCTVDCTPLNHAMSWDSTNGFVDLLPNDIWYSWASDINNPGVIVGHRQYTSLGITTYMAVIWDGGVAYNLNTLATTSGWNLGQAQSINDVGKIVGIGTFNNETHAFLLSPSGTATASDLSISLLSFPLVKPGARANAEAANKIKFYITNLGPDPATNAIATAEIPDGLTVDSIELSNGSCTVDTVLTCQIEQLDVDEKISVELSLSGEGEHAITVSLSSDNIDTGITANNNVVAYYKDGTITTTPQSDLPPGFIANDSTTQTGNIGFQFSRNPWINFVLLGLFFSGFATLRRFSNRS